MKQVKTAKDKEAAIFKQKIEFKELQIVQMKAQIEEAAKVNE